MYANIFTHTYTYTFIYICIRYIQGFANLLAFQHLVAQLPSICGLRSATEATQFAADLYYSHDGPNGSNVYAALRQVITHIYM